MKWGPWTLNTRNLTLEHKDIGYYVDLQNCNSSAEILDWICQIQGKTWADSATVSGLVAALDDILEPQANFCSMGQHRTGDATALVKAYIESQPD